MHFEHRFEAADFDEGMALLRDLRHDRLISVPMEPLLAADGAASSLRRRMNSLNLIEAREIDLEHGYKELSIPADAAGRYTMAADALHIWPRGNRMLIALPNSDGSFTATLFLAKEGDESFQSLRREADIEQFLCSNVPDARALMPNCIAEFGSPGRIPGHRGSAAVVPCRHGGVDRRLGARHGAVPRPGHELLL
jgi:kynurenine 3-monooxygenase